MDYNQLYKKDKALWGENPTSHLKLYWQLFTSKGHFLDLGCGQGKDTLFMAKNNFKITAVDSSREAIKQLERIIKNKNIKVIWDDIRKFNISSKKYDIINCNNVLQFLSKKEALKIIDDIKQKVKLNGFIVLSAFTTNDPSYKNKKIKNKLKTYFKPQEILKSFKDFKIVYYLEDLIFDKGHSGVPKPHKHGIVKIVAKKVK